jgi:hypothetical protein
MALCRLLPRRLSLLQLAYERGFACSSKIMILTFTGATHLLAAVSLFLQPHRRACTNGLVPVPKPRRTLSCRRRYFSLLCPARVEAFAHRAQLEIQRPNASQSLPLESKPRAAALGRAFGQAFGWSSSHPPSNPPFKRTCLRHAA